MLPAPRAVAKRLAGGSLKGRFSLAEAKRIACAARGYAALGRADRAAAGRLDFQGAASGAGIHYISLATPFDAATSQWFRRGGIADAPLHVVPAPCLGSAEAVAALDAALARIPAGATVALLRLRRSGLRAFLATATVIDPASPADVLKALDDAFLENPAQYRWNL